MFLKGRSRPSPEGQSPPPQSDETEHVRGGTPGAESRFGRRVAERRRIGSRSGTHGRPPRGGPFRCRCPAQSHPAQQQLAHDPGNSQQKARTGAHPTCMCVRAHARVCIACTHLGKGREQQVRRLEWSCWENWGQVVTAPAQVKPSWDIQNSGRHPGDQNGGHTE